MTKIKSNLNEDSINDLISSGNRVQNNHVEDPGEGVESCNYAYENGTKRFIIWGVYRGKEDTYSFKIDFLRTKAEEITSPEDLEKISQKEFEINIPYVQSDGRFLFITNYKKIFMIEPFDANSDDIQVRCSCPSYRFAYFKGNKNHRAATGANFPTYVPNGRGRPKPVVAGACKHLQIIFSILQENGIIR